MVRPRTVNAVGATLLIALIAAHGPAPAQAAFPGENGKIAFTCPRGVGICVTDPATGGHVVTNLTPGRNGAMPSFSADGRRITFSREVGGGRDDQYEIFVMDVDGGDVRRVTRSGGESFNYHPTFTPDGNRIVFADDEGISIVDAGGENRSSLRESGFEPSVAPSGESIAFIEPNGGGNRLFTMGIDGSEVMPVTSDDQDASARAPTWSPSGDRILFEYYAPPDFPLAIAAINPDGTGFTRVSPADLPGDSDQAGEPTFSPDGAKVAFLVDDCFDEICPDQPIYTADVEGDNVEKLVEGTFPGAEPDWGPAIPGQEPLRGRCKGRRATIVGTDNRDLITGTSRRDVISARRGSDSIEGLDGNDLLCGGKGRDRLEGAAGRDRLDGGPGSDLCAGGRQADRLRRCERRR
jgi:hypothetical protein